MNFVKKKLFCGIIRSFATTRTFSNQCFIENLSNRGLIAVKGSESIPFLQGLVTNDLHHLHQGAPGMYSMFLNKPGRILYDSILYKSKEIDTILVECDINVTDELTRYLKMFRVRRKIDISPINNDYNIWVICPMSEEKSDDSIKNLSKFNLENILVCNDPRVKHLGTRVILPKSWTNSNIYELFTNLKLSNSENNYKKLRYKLGVPEGIEDIPPTKCLPLEYNCDYMHGVSFQKGCYVGQELTARTYHTGIIRKRIMPFVSMELVKSQAEEICLPNGKAIGKIRGLCENLGITLIRIEQALEAPSLNIGNVLCTLMRPSWWPQELPKTVSGREK